MSPAAPPEPVPGPARPRAARARRRGAAGSAFRAGFTLIEVLVALAVVAAALAAIGLVVGGNARATRALEQRAALLETARAVEAGIPPRRQLKDGRIDGAIGGHAWRMDVRSLEVGEIPAEARFVPRDVLIRVRAPGGALMELETVRLVPTTAPREAAGDASGGGEGRGASPVDRP